MGDKGRGIPSRCRCGEDVVLRTSKTIKNPGRLFYACRYGEENGRGHLFKWTDETMVEEMEDIIPKIDELERASLTLQKGTVHILHKKVITDKKLNPENYISSWYLTSRWRNEYSAYIDAVRGCNFWRKSGETELVLPPKPEGRKRIPKRIKERNESPQKKKSKGKEKELKLSRKKRIIHCGICGGEGHNTRKCQFFGPAPYRRPKKVTESATVGSSSQPTQSQVID
ncbi:unnamed protein product [Arabidopsis arenosa]|uniref:GRF-type domain-containing protein n=1 Tax=Arabidopsis arenosa TaxID=38785 RepID=A0A8S2B5N1_ARAAE|nr:unnamed protein product [Arabidopsis arenosa]